MEGIRILSIETSCDETAIAVIEFEGNNFQIISEKLYSQVDTHQEYGGVFPTIAKREHSKILPKLTLSALTQSRNIIENDLDVSVEDRNELLAGEINSVFNGKGIEGIDYIAITNGPGLAPALWVGVTFANILSKIYNIPVIPVNHMEGHIYGSLIKENSLIEPDYPILSLLISGGHTELVLSKEKGQYEKIGKTLDDAVGETFDKVARMLGLPYPGGPEISKLAKEGKETIDFPRPMIKDDSLNFSYSGLKTSVRNYLEKNTDASKEDVSKSFEMAATEPLINKTEKAIQKYAPKTLVVGGGVSCNEYIQTELKALVDKYSDITLLLPEKRLSTDNAVMIGMVGYINRNKAIMGELSADSNRSL